MYIYIYIYIWYCYVLVDCYHMIDNKWVEVFIDNNCYLDIAIYLDITITAIIASVTQ